MTDEIGIMHKALAEYEHAKRLKTINENLFEHLTGSILYMIRYSKKYGIPLPKRAELFKMIENSQSIIDQMKPFRPTTLDSENNRRDLDSTLDQYPYKVHVPYHTVW